MEIAWIYHKNSTKILCFTLTVMNLVTSEL